MGEKIDLIGKGVAVNWVQRNRGKREFPFNTMNCPKEKLNREWVDTKSFTVPLAIASGLPLFSGLSNLIALIFYYHLTFTMQMFFPDINLN